jgi:hypothetical protein
VKLSRYGPATKKRAKISKCEMRLRVRNREIMRDGVLSSRWYVAMGRNGQQGSEVAGRVALGGDLEGV